MKYIWHMCIGIANALVVFLFLSKHTVLAADTPQFSPMIPVPGLNAGNINMEEYLGVVYMVAIGIAILIAVAKLMLAGFKYIATAVVTDKENAKADIWAALLGLLIIVSAVSILTFINPKLTNLPLMNQAPQFDPPPLAPSSKVVKPGESKAIHVQEQLRECKNIIVYNDGERCCNDDRACKPAPVTSETLEGFDPNKNTYTAAEISALVEKNAANVDIVDFGPNAIARTNEQMETMCKEAATSRNKEFQELIVLNQTLSASGIRQIQQRPLCIMKK